MLEIYLNLLELDYFEIGEALKGLADDNVWKRPAEGLLSVGEIVGHVCFGEASRLAGVVDDPATDQISVISSPLIDTRFDYYPRILATSPTPEQLAMTASELSEELNRIHNESVAIFQQRNPDLDSTMSGRYGGWTYKENLKYLIFHMAYHTGQIYTTRHLLGEKTVDN